MKKILPILLGFLLIGCEPFVTFDKPQPEGGRELNRFPRRLFGQYISPDGKSTLVISEKLIVKIVDYDSKTHKDSVVKYFKLKGDTLFTDSTSYNIVKVVGDSIVEHTHYRDTLFSISEMQVLKKFKGYYFLNGQFDKKAWIVQKLSLVKGILSLGSIKSEADISILKELTETKNDSVPLNFSLSRKRLKEFISLNVFGDREVYIKRK